MAQFIKLTSRLNTPIMVRKDLIAIVEGYDFGEEQGPPKGHRGARLTIMGGQWSETYYCLETSEQVIQLLEAAHG